MKYEYVYFRESIDETAYYYFRRSISTSYWYKPATKIGMLLYL